MVSTKPTVEEYNQAKRNITFASNALLFCQGRRNQLLDELIKERENEKHYLKLLEQYNEVVNTYEVFEKAGKD